MLVQKIADGLWRWSVPHPEWKPEFDKPGGGGWGRTVASVYAELPGSIVLIDPLLPVEAAERARFWESLDRDLAGQRGPLIVMVGSVDHGRSVDDIAARYRKDGREVAVIGDAGIREAVSCRLDATFDERPLPTGVRAEPIVGMSPGERAFFLEPWKAAVFADAVIGAGGGRVRVAPPSWGVKTEAGRATYDRGFRASLRAVGDLGPEILLPSHGEPILTSGRAVLAEALEAPAWGEA